MQKSSIVLLSALTVLGLAKVAAADPLPLGVLMDGPKEGSVSLVDNKGNWIGVDGIPVAHKSIEERSVTVAIIDSGILVDHPQLKGLVTLTQDFTGEGIRDRIGHGTVVAILAARSPELMPNIKKDDIVVPRLIVAKVAFANGIIFKSNVVLAIDWAAKHGAKIVNMSLGFKEGTDDYSDLCAEIAKHPQILFIAAAGNFGPDVRVYPANCKLENIVPVAAGKMNNGKWVLKDYSGKGQVIANDVVYLTPLK
jgi:subtilisin family serine protease